jgi:protein SCO1/2
LRLLAILLAGLLLAGCGKQEGPAFKATDITGAELGRELQLSDHNGTPRTLQDFQGKVLVVSFGFTHCPDVCPTTLAELARARKLLGADGERVQVVMVTVDPERDTPQVLREYVTALDPTFLGLTGDAEAIARTAREFKVFYQKSPGSSPQSYSVDHSSGTFVFDPAGRVRLLVSYGQGAEVFAHDIGQLLKG